MSDKNLRLLILEDRLLDAELCQRELKRAGFRFTSQLVDTRHAFEAALDQFAPDLIISDFSLPDAFDGLAALELARRKLPEVPFVFVSGTIGEERAVEAMKCGATDYVLKDRLARLAPVIRRAIQETEERAARKHAESALHESDARYRMLVESVKDYAIIALDTEGRIASWNSGAQRVEGYTAGEILGRHVSVFYPAEVARGEIDGMLRAASREGSHEWEGWRIRKDGSRFWANVVIAATVADDGTAQGYSEVTRDITERKMHEERLNYLAYYDVLTGLPNRTLFKDRLEQRISAARGDKKIFAVMMLDIERFRHINETLGRQAGDDLLREFTQRLKSALEETDVLSHLGGDYFAIATRQAEGDGDVVRLLERILAAVSGRPFTVAGSDLRVASRAGVAIYPADGSDAEGLLKNAEAALKDSKRTGQKPLFYAPEMNARVAEKLQLENRLRVALREEQFVLHYQPRVALATGRISGVEALIRWACPDRGLIPPAEFIPMLEETGMILEVGEWALRRATADIAAWSAKGLRAPRIAVNVSALQLRQKNFVENVWIAVSGGSYADCIDIELTESIIMEHIEANITKLREIRAAGMQVAIDDFGTGYSSLSYLVLLPVDALKIDQSFVSRMTTSPEHMSIVSTVIALAHSLNLKVTAEGVETEEQRDLLKLLKCDEMQGYLFSKPLPPRELAHLLQQREGTF